jgi:hypothetical protein
MCTKKPLRANARRRSHSKARRCLQNYLPPPALFMSAPALMTQCLFGIMRKMPAECAAGKIEKLVNAIRAEGLSTSMARVERLIAEAAPAAKKAPAKKAAKK